MTGGGPQLFQKRLRRFVEETLLTLIADLNHSYVGEASLPNTDGPTRPGDRRHRTTVVVRTEHLIEC